MSRVWLLRKAARTATTTASQEQRSAVTPARIRWREANAECYSRVAGMVIPSSSRCSPHLVDVGDLQGDRPEHVDDQQVGRSCGVDGVESGVGEEFEEPFVQSAGP